MSDLESTIEQHIPAAMRAAALTRVGSAIKTYRRDAKPGRAASRPSISKQRPQLLKIAACADKLAALLDGLSFPVGIYLTPNVTDPQLDQVSESLRQLNLKAKLAHQQLANSNKTAPKDPPFHDLLVNLVITWSHAHPKQHGVTRNSDRYSGPLLHFVVAVLNSQNIPVGDLGRRLYNLDLPFRRLPRETEQPHEK